MEPIACRKKSHKISNEKRQNNSLEMNYMKQLHFITKPLDI